MSLISTTFSAVTSRPPKPAIKLTTWGRFSNEYNADRISVASTPAWKGEPNE
jgi:hypothetical protein